MQIESLKLFCDVVQLSSFSKAAKNNQLTQSTISQTINNLEKHLGVLLIDRSLRPWKLTTEGRIFYEGCRKLVQDYRELENHVKKNYEQNSSVVRIATFYSVGLKQMKHLVNKFSNLNPSINIEFKYLRSSDVYNSVLRDEVDFGIISFPKAQRELLITPWKIEQMILICPPEHRLSRQKIIAMQQIAGEKLIRFNPDMEIRKQIDRFLKNHEINFEESLEFDNIESIKRAVEIASGISIVPEPTITQEVANGTLAGIPFMNNEIVRPIGMIQRRSRRLTQAAQDFKDFLNKEK